ncbi:MAG: ABC transporter substrate-binding protein [Christensenellaceae bacterium]
MKKVKWFALLLSVLMIFALAACGSPKTPAESPASSEAAAPEASSEAPAESESAAPAPEASSEAPEAAEGDASEEMVDTTEFKMEDTSKSPVIGFSDISIANAWRQQMSYELKNHAEELGITLHVTDAGDDQAKQVSDIQDLIAKGIDGLLVSPGSTTATSAVQKQALAQGIPVVLINAEVEDPTAYTGYVSVNYMDQGYQSAKWLFNQMGGEGNVIMLNGMAGTSTDMLNQDGFRKAMEELPDGGEKINILASYDADWAYDKGKQATEQALAAYPDIDGVWTQGGAMAQGAIEAFQAAGRELVPVTGEDNNGFLKLWKQLQPEGFTSIAVSDPTYQGVEALDAVLAALKGEPILKKNYIPTPTITDDTLDEYVRMDYSDAYFCNSTLPKEVADQYYLED